MLEVISREESKLYLKTSISDHFVIYTDRRKLIFFSFCVVHIFTKTVIHFGVGESHGNLPLHLVDITVND